MEQQTIIKQSKTDEMFTLVQDKKTKKVKIVIGNYQIAKKEFDNFKDAECYIATKPYEILINAICLFTHLQMKSENENKTNKTAE